MLNVSFKIFMKVLAKRISSLACRIRDGNGAGTGWVEHTHARPDMGSG
jgi:hypothetical protein